MKIKVVKSILLFFMGLAIPVVIFRFLKGLGATTNLTEVTPWGFWIGFDVVDGVALAAGYPDSFFGVCCSSCRAYI